EHDYGSNDAGDRCESGHRTVLQRIAEGITGAPPEPSPRPVTAKRMKNFKAPTRHRLSLGDGAGHCSTALPERGASHGRISSRAVSLSVWISAVTFGRRSGS